MIYLPFIFKFEHQAHIQVDKTYHTFYLLQENEINLHDKSENDFKTRFIFITFLTEFFLLQTTSQPYTNIYTRTTNLGCHFRFLEGLSNDCFMPPPLLVWNFRFCAVSAIHGESNCVVSCSIRWVYLVRPDRPKFLT